MLDFRRFVALILAIAVALTPIVHALAWNETFVDTSTRLSISYYSLDLKICAGLNSNVTGKPILIQTYRPGVNGPERFFKDRLIYGPARGACTIAYDLDEAGPTVSTVRYITVISLNPIEPISHDGIKWLYANTDKTGSCWQSTSNEHLCDKAAR